VAVAAVVAVVVEMAVVGIFRRRQDRATRSYRRCQGRASRSRCRRFHHSRSRGRSRGHLEVEAPAAPTADQFRRLSRQ
jgi:hypothetical protein